MRGPATRGARPRLGAHVVPVMFVLALFLGPLVVVLLGSLRPIGTAPPVSIDVVPPGAGLSNYGDVLGNEVLRREALNSLLVAAIAVPLGTLVASLAGFAIARLDRRAALLLLGLTLVAAAVPASTLFVGRLVLFRIAALTDSPVPLIAPALVGVSPLLVLLFAWSYHSVPGDVYDLAREAGLGPFRTWWVVAMPLRLPVVVVAAAIAFLVSWGNLTDPLLYVYDERWYTLPLGLASLAQLPPADHGLLLAASVLAIVPVLVSALLIQRFASDRTWS